MGKLHTLATHCINDTRFYDKTLNTKIFNSNNYLNPYKRNISVIDNTITPKKNKSVRSQLFYNEAHRLYNKEGDTFIINDTPYNETLMITFADEPSIRVEINRILESEEDVTISLDIKEKIFGIPCIPRTYTATCEIQTFKYECRIVCGSVKEIITYEQYCELVDSYSKMKWQCLQDKDMAKINERLMFFEKK